MWIRLNCIISVLLFTNMSFLLPYVMKSLISKSMKVSSIHPLFRHYTRSKILYLNRILGEWNECSMNDRNEIILSLKKDDYRFSHIMTILKMNSGDSLRCGVIDMGMNDQSILEYVNKEDKVTINLGIKEKLRTIEVPKVDLVLAVPRPLRLDRLLSVVSCMGIGQLVLIGANKVSKDYFGSQLFVNPKGFRDGFIEGLSQTEVDCNVPKLHIQKNFRKFINEEVDVLFPPEIYRRVITHPVLPILDPEIDQRIPSLRLFESSNKLNIETCDNRQRIVVVIGPEGGWENREIQAFVDKGFDVVNLGHRILRTDIAVPAVLAIAHEWIETRNKKHPL